MENKGMFENELSRREAMKTALKAGAYATPVILASAVPISGVAAATPPPGPVGVLVGVVNNASTGQPIAGATVTVGGRSATTDNMGNFRITNVPAGVQTIQTSASGFAPRTDRATIAANATTTVSIALVPLSTTAITIVLTWGQQPSDLDSHLSGPDVENPSPPRVSRTAKRVPQVVPHVAGRFHVAFYSQQPVSYASLDVDDITSFGPETVTVSRLQTTNQFVSGDYHYWVNNYSETPEFNVSNAVVTVFKLGAQIAQFSVNDVTGDPSLDIWRVFNFTLAADGTVNITPIQNFVAGDSSDIF